MQFNLIDNSILLYITQLSFTNKLPAVSRLIVSGEGCYVCGCMFQKRLDVFKKLVKERIKKRRIKIKK